MSRAAWIAALLTVGLALSLVALAASTARPWRVTGTSRLPRVRPASCPAHLEPAPRARRCGRYRLVRRLRRRGDRGPRGRHRGHRLRPPAKRRLPGRGGPGELAGPVRADVGALPGHGACRSSGTTSMAPRGRRATSSTSGQQPGGARTRVGTSSTSGAGAYTR